MRTDDLQLLRRTLGLAREWVGQCWPNPAVGACLLFPDGGIVDGVHRGPGTSHAEIMAIEAAQAVGRDLSRSTLYVSLEPCNHHGRTAPCSDGILAAGIPRVVFACGDPNPRVAGGGASRLAAAGIAVERGTEGMESLARELNHAYFEAEFGARPHLTLKLAADPEGRIARFAGRVSRVEDRAITGERVQRRVHRMRHGSSCVLVGRGTVEADRPRLDVRRIAARHQPRPVVLDSGLRSAEADLPRGSLLLHAVAAEERAAALRAAGHECAALPEGPRSWDAVLSELGRRGLGIVLVEGGAEVATTALASGLVHRLHLFLTQRRLGGEGPQVDFLRQLGLGRSGPPEAQSLRLGDGDWKLLRRRRIGGDWEWILGATSPPT